MVVMVAAEWAVGEGTSGVAGVRVRRVERKWNEDRSVGWEAACGMGKVAEV